ncbi:NACHT domain-containing protein [Nocardiopsis sp. MG754419]|uniref:NACHT domain-containing protein n=1 Tax=Nocardiopsis sp. MG754419 TaxID=2259865 RepID=UPI001BA89994|nr:NACHT domain-containing protein [Nocardiopsis sp. MG754419]MBR8742281.1 hypothetical protein [Nocardiopsis sp. MG754419]
MLDAGKRTRIVLGATLTGVLTSGPFLMGREAVTPGAEPAVWAAAVAAAAYTSWSVVAHRRETRAGAAAGTGAGRSPDRSRAPNPEHGVHPDLTTVDEGTPYAHHPGPAPTRPLRVGFTSPDGSAPDGDLDDVDAVFLDLPHPRLLVLGEPGAGKSYLAATLARRFTESAPERRALILPLDTWNPEANGDVALHAARTVGRGLVPETGSPSDLSTVRELRTLIHGGRVLVVLDGLDEVRPAWRPSALAAIERLCTGDTPLVVTCRTRDLAEWERLAPRALPDCARIALDPVAPGDALDYLTDAAPPDPRWDAVVEQLEHRRRGPLAHALRSPLTLDLARIVHRRPQTRPADMVEVAARSSLLGHLVDQRIRGEDATVDPEHARIWSAHLAYHLYSTGRRRFHWWRMHVGLLPRWFTHGLLPVLVAAPLAALTSPVLGTGTVAASPESPVALAALLLLGSLGVFAPLWRNTDLSTEGHPRDNTRGMEWDRPAHAWSALVYGSLVGVAVTGGVMGLLTGALFGVLLGFVQGWLNRPRSGPRVEVGPADTLVAAARLGFVAGVWGALFFGVASWAIPRMDGALSAAGAAFLVCALTAAHPFGVWPWARFRVAHLVLAVRGRLPWRLGAFVDHLRGTGTVRGHGPSWRFHHVLIRDQQADDVEIARLTAQVRSLYGAAGQGGDPQGRRLDESVQLHNLVELHAERGDVEALRGLVRDRRSATAEIRLADVLADRGDHDGLRALALEGGHPARIRWADVLVEHGELDQLRLLAATGDHAVAARLTDALAARGATGELAAMADHGGWEATAAQVARLPTLHYVPDGTVWTAAQALERLGTSALADTPRRHAAHHLAALLAERGDLEELSARSDAGDWWSADRLASLLAEKGDLSALAERAERGDWWSAQRLAPALLARGDLAEAARLLETYRLEGHCWAFLGQADLYARDGDTEEALRVLEEIRDRDRDKVGSHLWSIDAKIIDLYLEDGRLEAALPELRRQADRGREWAGRRLAVVLRDLGHWAELERRARLGDAGAALTLADAQVADGRPERAVRTLELGFGPRPEEIGEALADAYARSGRVRALRRSARRDPRARRRLARFLAERGRHDEALDLLRAPRRSGAARDTDTTRLLLELHRSRTDARATG